MTRMYKEAGNTMVVPVMENIFKNLNIKEGVKVAELFGGVGASTTALENMGLNPNVVEYVEKEKTVTKSYNALHNTNFKASDIVDYANDTKKRKIDLLVHGSPCQSNSRLNNSMEKGMAEGSNTKSSLLWESFKSIKRDMPKIVVWENVKDATRFKGYQEYLDKMQELGYTNYAQVLNARNFGVPQNRERIFVVSRLDGKKFAFPNGSEKANNLTDYLDDNQTKYSFGYHAGDLGKSRTDDYTGQGGRGTGNFGFAVNNAAPNDGTIEIEDKDNALVELAGFYEVN